MDGMRLLQEAHAAGLTVFAEDERLVVRGPRRYAPLAQALIDNKYAVLMALSVVRLPLDWRATWEERAAIREYEGGQSRDRAEVDALAEIHEAMRVEASAGRR